MASSISAGAADLAAGRLSGPPLLGRPIYIMSTDGRRCSRRRRRDVDVAQATNEHRMNDWAPPHAGWPARAAAVERETARCR